MATHSSVLAWRIPGTGSLVGSGVMSSCFLVTVTTDRAEKDELAPGGCRGEQGPWEQ